MSVRLAPGATGALTITVSMTSDSDWPDYIEMVLPDGRSRRYRYPEAEAVSTTRVTQTGDNK